MRHKTRGSCLCDACCEKARTGSRQYYQQYGPSGVGSPGNGLGRVGGDWPVGVDRCYRQAKFLGSANRLRQQ